MKYNFVIFGTDYDLYRYTFHDAIELENVKYFGDVKELFNPVEKFLYKIHFSQKINKIVKLPFKRIWNRVIVNKIKFQNDKPTCIVWFWHFYNILENGFVEEAKEKNINYRHAFFFGDCKNIAKANLELMRKRMDVVAVFDKKTARKYDMLFLPHVYSDVVNFQRMKNEYDVSFVGFDKGRSELLEKIAEKCNEKGITTAFYVRGAEMEKESAAGVKYGKEQLSYMETLDIVKKSNCLLELKVEPYDSCSLRVQEAVGYGKKILTNNSNIYNMPCCKKNSAISVFKTVEDIDFEFLKANVNVDYHYNGEYSPIKFLEEIEKNL